MIIANTIKWNTVANFLGLGYRSLIGIVIFPLYLQYLSAEAFGLVGFYTVLLAWMQLLDMGLSPMLSKYAAEARGGNIEFDALHRLTRSLELIFFVVAFSVSSMIAVGSSWVSTNWLNVTSLLLLDVNICITLMGAMIGLHFFASLYRSGIQGMENQVWLNIANILLITLKFGGGLLLLRFVTHNIVHYFIYQFVVSIVELVVLASGFYRLLPPLERLGISFFGDTLKPKLPFAGGIAYATVIWVLLTQLDKLILSNLLPLSEYGYFALITVVATGIIQISSPISQALLPRMTYLIAQGKEADLLVLYRKSTQLMAAVMMPLSGLIAIFGKELLFAWTGDLKAAEWAGPILFWFALGNGILALCAFQYYLQFAYGKLRLHVIYNTILASIQIPAIVYAAIEYGALGVGLVWFLLTVVSFFAWTPYVHKKFAPNIHRPWLLKDVGPNFLSTVVSLFFFHSLRFQFFAMTRVKALFLLFGIWLAAVLFNASLGKESRQVIINILKRIPLKQN